MQRLLAAALAACGVILAAAHVGHAQQPAPPVPPMPAQLPGSPWNDARTRDLVTRATQRRIEQLADTGLRDFRAIAHGYVTFLAQVGEGLAEPPKIVKADELYNEVYWLAPDLSKQRIVGRRDTLLLPTDISYHRDHLGIVQNNFPSVIRLGDGDEVRDVPHPLSLAGLQSYEYQITDSLGFNLPGRRIQVYEVKVRPRDDRQARIIGALFIDRDDAQVVRMAFNFTRAAFLDKALEDLFVVIENSLVQGRFWLPRRQEIEIRRGGTWLDYPVRGIIRGRWEISDYAVNTGLSRGFFTGPEIVLAPQAVTDTFRFSGRVLDSLPPEVRAVTDADIRRVQEEARSLVRAQALRRPQRLGLRASGLSDFARFDRAEGLALGLGASTRFGGGYGVQGRARYGFDDRTVKGGVTAEWQSPRWGARAFLSRDFRDAGDVQERSRLFNSIAAQEFGADATDPFLVRGGGAGLDLRELLGARWRLDATVERHSPLGIRARPAHGEFPPLVGAVPLRAARLALGMDRPTALGPFGTELRIIGELRLSRMRLDEQQAAASAFWSGRAFASVQAERPFNAGRLALSLAGGLVGADRAGIPAQELLYFGGPVSAPGYRLHELAGTAGATARAEWRVRIPAPTISLGRFGRVPGSATLAPFVQGTVIRRALAGDTAHPTGGYPSAGVAVHTLFDLLRVQLARGLRNGSWSLNVDVSRDFWSVL